MTGVGQSRRRIRAIGRKMARGLMCLSLSVFLLTAPPAPRAYACTNCGAIFIAMGSSLAVYTGVQLALRNMINRLFNEFKQRFMIDTFFDKFLLSSLQSLSNQLTAASMGQAMMVGAFLDAQEQMERQMLFQELTARAHKDYHPSMQMCTFGTAARGLGTSARNAEMAAYALAEHSVKRQLHNANASGASGRDVDKGGRLGRFIERYCDAYDNNYEAGAVAGPGTVSGLTPFCSNAKPANNKWATNRDVDAARLFNTMTYRARYGGTPQQENPDLFALASNLYGHDIINPVPEALLSANTPADINGNQDILLDIRSIVAKRAVAEDSFNQIAGMHTADSDSGAAAAPFMASLLQAMGYSPDDAQQAVGAYPSYDARMELLTKKLYMEPEFYTNLYDAPANVARAGAAIRAINLAQNMDLFKSRLRNEMSLSVLLELEIEKEQERVNNRLEALRSSE